MYTWTPSEFWHKVKRDRKASEEQIKFLKELGWDNTTALTYQGAECILQEIIENAF